MAFVADDFGAWLVGALAEAGRRKLTAVVLGGEQERALRQAATAAVLTTATELESVGGARAGELAMVINEVFNVSATGALAGQATVLEGLQAGVTARLAMLGDASITGTGQSSADVLAVDAAVVSQRLAEHLVREIIGRGARGGPLAVGQLAAERGMPFVCVQPLMSAWARRAEDLTFDKTDDKDAVLITRLTAQLRCYRPEPADATWARLRQLGIRRARLVAGQVAQVQQMGDLLECAWPAVLDAARQPFKSTTWHAALTVALSRADGDLASVTRLGRVRFDAAVRRQVARWDAVNPWQKIIDAVFTACADPAGVTELRHGALERVRLLLAGWRDTQARLAGTEQRMVTVPGDLGLTGLVTSITGLSAVGAASVLAETGDPRRFTSGRALVKHAGLAPRQKSSGSCTGRTRMTGQGRPGLRLAAWRAVWGALKSNPVYAARFAHLTGRENNRLSTGQAHAALAAALLRHLHAVITTGQRWDPAIAAGGQPDQTLNAA